MKPMTLWVRRVTMEIIVRAPDIRRADEMTDAMVSAAIDCGRQAAVHGDVEAQAFVEFDDLPRPLVEKSHLSNSVADSGSGDETSNRQR